MMGKRKRECIEVVLSIHSLFEFIKLRHQDVSVLAALPWACASYFEEMLLYAVHNLPDDVLKNYLPFNSTLFKPRIIYQYLDRTLRISTSSYQFGTGE